MLWLHPVLMGLANLVGLYAAYLGMERFLSRHMGMRTQFLWKRHVFMGSAAMLLWVGGMGGGLAMARYAWQVNFVTGDHYQTAFAMLPLIAFGGATGYIMHRNKARRTLLPLAHAVCNLLLLGMAFYQYKTGWQVLRDFVL